MQILFIHQAFPAQFGSFVADLISRGHEVHGIGASPGRASPEGCRHHLYDAPRLEDLPDGLSDPQLEAALVRAERVAELGQTLSQQGFKPDVVVVHSGWGEGLYLRDLWPDALLLAYPELYGQPALLQLDDPDAPPATDQRLRLLRRQNLLALAALADADALWTPTLFQRNSFPAPWRGRLQVIHEGVDTRRNAPQPGRRIQARQDLELGSEDLVLTFVSRSLEPLRGFCRFMRSLPPLLQAHPRLQVVVVGGDGHSYSPPSPHPLGYLGEMREQLGSSLDPNRFHAVGLLEPEQLTALFQVTTVHAYLSHPYVLSWSLLEAMACSAVVVGSDTAPVREVIQHQRNGLLAPLHDLDGLVATIDGVLRDPPAHRHLGTAARQTILSRYRLDKGQRSFHDWLISLRLLQTARGKP